MSTRLLQACRLPAIRHHATFRAAFRPLSTVTLVPGGLEITPEGVWGVKRFVLPNLWLRDNCRCAECINQGTMRRNLNVFRISPDVRPLMINTDPEALHVSWSDNNHKSQYQWEFIYHYLQHDHRKPEPIKFKYWGHEIAENPPAVNYDTVINGISDDGVAALMSKIREYGFAVVEDTPDSDPECTRRLLERILSVGATHFANPYEFISDLSSIDPIYINQAQSVHTDRTYFADPSSLQALHVLSKSPSPLGTTAYSRLGGDALLVDGFHAAKLLHSEDPVAYDVLHKVRLSWYVSNGSGCVITPDQGYPVLEVDERTGDHHSIFRVRWNNAERGAVPFDDGISPTKWYEAARKWDAILKRKDVECRVDLIPRRVLILDNWRVLHGQDAFEGSRRICAGYVNREHFISRWRYVNYSREQVLEHVIG